MPTRNTTLALIVTERPEAARVLHSAGLDFCCGGERTLAEACQERGLDPEVLLERLEPNEPQHGTSAVIWEQESPASLVDHIVERFHEPLRAELPRLLELAGRVELVHADKPDCPSGLQRHLARVHGAVTAHLDKEEQILFPMIVEGRGRLALMPVQVMMQEHHDHAANLRRTRALTGDLKTPAHACASWRELYTSLLRLELDLMEHIHLENNVLFPKVLAG